MREHALWQAGEGVLVGVSGGPDSVALLAALAELPARLRPRLVAAHFDHGLRGAEGAADARLASQVAAALGVPCRLGRAPSGEPGVGLSSPPVGAPASAADRARSPAADAAGEGTGGAGAAPDRATARAGEATAGGRPPRSEDTLRRARYAFLAREARAAGCAVVAVGHHADDQAETVLLRLGRGAGARGLAAMAPSRPLRADGGPPLRLVRPLLAATRADVLHFLALRGLPWRQDPSNADLAFARNRVRHLALPALARALDPGAPARLARAAANLREDALALDWLAAAAAAARCRDGCFLPGEDWADLPPAVRRALLRAWWQGLAERRMLSRASLLQLERLAADAGAEGAWVAVPGGMRVRRSAGALRLEAPGGGATLLLEAPGRARVPGWGEVRAELVAWPDEDLWRECLAGRLAAVGDAAGWHWPLRLRPPLPGERVVPLGTSGPRRVRDLLAAARVPVALRDAALVLEDSAGRVLWLAGCRQTADFRLRPGTRSALLLRLLPDGEPAAVPPAAGSWR